MNQGLFYTELMTKLMRLEIKFEQSLVLEPFQSAEV